MLTRSDGQSHRPYRFYVPEHCSRLHIHVVYDPKLLDEQTSTTLARSAVKAQAEQLMERVGHELAARWSADSAQGAARVRIPNLLTVSLDDASGNYRGAAHRQSPG